MSNPVLADLRELVELKRLVEAVLPQWHLVKRMNTWYVEVNGALRAAFADAGLEVPNA